ncbi:uncharacterized protein LOC128073214 [Tympanuchus pallidicinctus]|uniref:uncharacterized protein LOC128073214 n=1 Tax=Tympanuchus pallidicinctus TaxID=109042 RepID=UPI002287094C|nr:uncharacterized protein LOC128073214 [Tympanuchus pallidicinctus]
MAPAPPRGTKLPTSARLRRPHNPTWQRGRARPQRAAARGEAVRERERGSAPPPRPCAVRAAAAFRSRPSSPASWRGAFRPALPCPALSTCPAGPAAAAGRGVRRAEEEGARNEEGARSVAVLPRLRGQLAGPLAAAKLSAPGLKARTGPRCVRLGSEEVCAKSSQETPFVLSEVRQHSERPGSMLCGTSGAELLSSFESSVVQLVT